MATYTGYNLEDPAVREIVTNNHIIGEQRIEDERGISLMVMCCQCKTPWPCLIRQDLTDWEQAQLAS